MGVGWGGLKGGLSGPSGSARVLRHKAEHLTSLEPRAGGKVYTGHLRFKTVPGCY